MRGRSNQNYYRPVTYQPIILSYHRFGEEYDDYPFSRTYEQFGHDLRKKIFDCVTIDDGHVSMIKACEIMREHNVRGKLFIPTALVGTEDYCSWEELKILSEWHCIEPHCHTHERLDKLSYFEVFANIQTAIGLIDIHLNKKARFFASPWNQYSDEVRQVCDDLGLIIMDGRIDIKNDSK